MLVVALAALLLLVVAGVLVVPRPVALAGELGFKRVLAHVWRGLLDDTRWAARVADAVAWHPAGRLPERKLAAPGVAAIDGAPLEGEEALVAGLAALPGAVERWEVLRGRGEGLCEAPTAREQSPAAWLGPKGAWERLPALGRGDDALVKDLEGRLGARWAVVAGTARPGVPDVTGAFGEAVPWSAGEGRPEALLAAAVLARALREGPPLGPAIELVRRVQDVVLACLSAELSVRLRGEGWLLLLVTGEAAPVVLRTLHDDVALRDRVLAVLSVGGAIAGLPQRADGLSEAACRDWLDVHFRHEQMDVEVLRRVPYLSLAWLDPTEAGPPGAAGVPVASARFPRPGFTGGGRFLEPKEPEVIVPVDLGVLDPRVAPPAPVIGAALRLWAGLWALAQAG